MENLENEYVPYYKAYRNNAIRGVIASSCFLAVFIVIGLVKKYRWRVVKIDGVESETDLDSINDYNLDCENGSKVLEDIVKISEKRRKFDVVSVTHGINEENLCKILDNEGSKGSGTSSSGCSSRENPSEGDRHDEGVRHEENRGCGGVENLGLEPEERAGQRSDKI